MESEEASDPGTKDYFVSQADDLSDKHRGKICCHCTDVCEFFNYASYSF